MEVRQMNICGEMLESSSTRTPDASTRTCSGGYEFGPTHRPNSFLETVFHKAKAGTKASSKTSNGNNNGNDNDNGFASSESKSMRMLLKGPSQSGKTSIAMDFAYSMASGNSNFISEGEVAGSSADASTSASEAHDADICSICQLPMYQSVSASESTSAPAPAPAPIPTPTSCQCCAVTFLIPQSKRSLMNFPLRCYNMSMECNDESEDHDEEAQAHASLNEMELMVDGEFYNTSGDGHGHGRQQLDENSTIRRRRKRRYCQSSWNTNEDIHMDMDKVASSLQRIHVKYIQSCEELVQYLASIQSLPPHKRPSRGIIVDDLDWYIRRHGYGHGLGDEEIVNNNNNGDGSVRLLFQEEESSNIDQCRQLTSPSSPKDATNMETMRLMNLLAIMADTCNYFDSDSNSNNRSPMKLITCLNSDRLPLPESLNHLLENYVNGVGTIVKKNDTSHDVFNMNKNVAMSMKRTISTWGMRVEYDPWLESGFGYCYAANDSSLPRSKCQVDASFSIGWTSDDGSGISADDYEYEDDEPNAIFWALS